MGHATSGVVTGYVRTDMTDGWGVVPKRRPYTADKATGEEFWWDFKAACALLRRPATNLLLVRQLARAGKGLK